MKFGLRGTANIIAPFLRKTPYSQQKNEKIVEYTITDQVCLTSAGIDSSNERMVPSRVAPVTVIVPAYNEERIRSNIIQLGTTNHAS